MKKILNVALGIVTSIGGFLDVGSIATSAQAGAAFGFSLIWAIVLGTICVSFLVEMTGRLGAISKHTLGDALRERFGAKFFMLPYLVEYIVDFLLLASEIGGVCIALQLATGIGFRWWALPVALAVWLLLWRGTFGLIENGVASLGLVTLVFVAGSFAMHPSLAALGAGLLPSLPRHDTAHYLFIAVSIIGAVITPFLLYFYSSGAIEDKWDKDYLGTNRMVAGLGMGFGGIVSVAVLVVSGAVLFPRGIQMDSYEQAVLALVVPFGGWGFALFIAALTIACFGACLEVSLSTAYLTAQGFGWNWGESQKPNQDARFSLVYTCNIFLASLLMLAGIDPLQLTLFTMALIATMLPIVVIPLLILMNDKRYLGDYRNGWLSNSVVVFVILLTFVLALISIPLEILGGS
jgi:Mn2+/Fe2+ NRAMP family transporter